MSEELKGLNRCLDVLEYCESALRAPTVADIGRELGLDRAVVHRIVRTLEARHLLVGMDDGYRLGLGSLRLGLSSLDLLTIRRVALAASVELGTEVLLDRPWVVSLSVPLNDEALVVERYWNPRSAFSRALDLGSRQPLDRSALGCAMLATIPRERALALVGELRLAEVEPFLDDVREAGYALASYDGGGEISGIATAITDANGVGMAALGVSGEGVIEAVARDREIAVSLRHHASRIESIVRGVPPLERTRPLTARHGFKLVNPASLKHRVPR